MNQELALRVLSDIMGWSDDQARDEFAWVRLMARLKYDGYRDFLAGGRFIENLARWIQQFKPGVERQAAYEFVRKRLVYVSPAEMTRLVELFYPREVHNRLLTIVAQRFGIQKYRVWMNKQATSEFYKQRRKTLFMGLSDGARIDIVRHANVGVLNNEQLVGMTQIDLDKWEDLLKNLREDIKDNAAKFSVVYLIDDFMGTGSSVLRKDEEKKEWKGKLKRFWDSIQDAAAKLPDGIPFEDGWQLHVHHYMGTHRAHTRIREIDEAARQEFGAGKWFQAVDFSFGTVLPHDLPVSNIRDPDFFALTQQYYDPAIQTRHTAVGGVDHMGLGYGGCALPLVIEHNTPNDSVALLWAETDGKTGNGEVVPAMRALFRRRSRHT